MADRVVRCRMTNTTNDRCTGEALDPNGEVLICLRHAALVLELVRAAEVVREQCADERGLLAVERLLLSEERALLSEARDGLVEAKRMVKEIAR